MNKLFYFCFFKKQKPKNQKLPRRRTLYEFLTLNTTSYKKISENTFREIIFYVENRLIISYTLKRYFIVFVCVVFRKANLR